MEGTNEGLAASGGSRENRGSAKEDLHVMGLSDSSGSQRFPVSADEAWTHLRRIAPRIGRVKEADEFLKRMVISAGISGFSLGETISVQVQQVNETACDVVVTSGLKLGLNLGGAHRNQKNVQKVVSALSASLQAFSARGSGVADSAPPGPPSAPRSRLRRGRRRR
jgi:hypothetical protein